MGLAIKMWQVIYDDYALKQLKKLDKQVQQDILRYMRERIATSQDPRRFGRGLTGDLRGLWRYRVQDYRILCQITDQKLRVLVVDVDHRKDIY